MDPLRGLVCLGVVVMHLYTATLHPQLEAVFGSGVDFVLNYLRLGVESFFVLAGFFLAHMLRPSDGEFLSVPLLLRRRFLRLAIPYWGAVALVCGDRIAANALLGRDNYVPGVAELLAILLFVRDISGVRPLVYFYWSMAALFQFYLLTAATFWLVRRVYLWRGVTDYAARTRRTMFVFAGAVVVGSVGINLAGLTSRWHLPNLAYLFTFGSLVYWASHGQLRWRWVVLAAVPILGLAILAESPVPVKGLVCGLILARLATGHPLPSYWPVRALAYIGRRSFSIYLLHGWIGFRLLNMANHLPSAPAAPLAVAIFAAAVAVSVVAGLIYYKLVEEPVARMAGRVTYRR